MSVRHESARQLNRVECSSPKSLALDCDVEDPHQRPPRSRRSSFSTLVPSITLDTPSRGDVKVGGSRRLSDSPIERFLKSGKGEPSIALEQRATSPAPSQESSPSSLPSTSKTPPISLHSTRPSNTSDDSQSESHSPASESLVRIQASSPSSPSPVSPKKLRSPRRCSTSTSYFSFKPIATPVSWSSVEVLRVQFRPSSSSDAAVNSWLIGLHSLKRGGKRSWDPRSRDEDAEKEEWPGVETSSGSPASIEVVYSGRKKYRFSPDKLSQEEIMKAVLSPAF